MTAEQAGQAVFQAFCPGGYSTTRKYGGTGLALTISKRLARDDGRGNLGGKRAQGRGSTFSFTADFGLGKEKGKKRYKPTSGCAA